jgi:hypothetical protein
MEPPETVLLAATELQSDGVPTHVATTVLLWWQLARGQQRGRQGKTKTNLINRAWAPTCGQPNSQLKLIQ